MAAVRYFLPEDGDLEEAPNVFLSPKPTRPGYPPCVGQIKSGFPLPGSYHFRFKTALVPGTDRDKNVVSVWMDCVDDSAPVPVWQGSIMAKVTRISAMDDDVETYDDDFEGRDIQRKESNVSSYSAASSSGRSASQPPPPRAAPAPVPPPVAAVHSTDSLLGFDDHPPAPAAPAAAASAMASNQSDTGNLLDVGHPPAPSSAGSLLDMGGGGYSSGANTPSHSDHDDLLNMSAPMPVQNHVPPPQGAQRVTPQRAPMQPPHMQAQRPHPGMQGQYPMQGQQGQYPTRQQGMQPGQVQPPRAMPGGAGSAGMTNGAPANKNAFDKFGGGSLDPLGNLSWQ